jgi:FO synthase
MLSELHAALSRVERSLDVDERDAETLLAARGDDLEQLLVVAARIRDDGLERSGRTGVITYSKKVFIPITFLCQDRCHYCTFVETPGALAHLGKPSYLSPDDILEIARAGAALGCKEALFTLGDRPGSTSTGMRRRSTTSGPWRCSCSRRPACFRTSIPA